MGSLCLAVKDHPRDPPLGSDDGDRWAFGRSWMQDWGAGRRRVHVGRSLLQLYKAPHEAAHKQQSGFVGSSA